MLAASLSSLTESTHIRKVDITRDLDTIADLIEMCFPIHLDRDGQIYLMQMRKTAREMRIMGWLSTLSELGGSGVSGFVWEEEGQIVGNLSLIPFTQSGKRFHMIANVAVHPDNRRQGIARALTERALGYLRRCYEPYVWLQVRDDNPAACGLYRSAGFVDQAVRTTWRIRPFEMCWKDQAKHASIVIRRRQSADWGNQQDWLQTCYPLLIRWNLLVDFKRFEPGFLRDLLNVMDGMLFRHWSFGEEENLLGVITWQKTESFTNNIWLAFPEDGDGDLLAPGLRLVLKRLSPRHTLSIDYPKGLCTNVFTSLGFHQFRTLIWMRCDL